MRTVRAHLPWTLLGALVAAALWTLLLTSPAGAAGSCDRVASPAGSDSNTGTAASPLKTAERLIEVLANGQTGCLRAGTFEAHDAFEVRGPGITLTSYPGERATIKGLLKIHQTAAGMTVRDLNIDGRSAYNMGPMVFAANVSFDNVDVTNHNTGICFILGPIDPAYGRAVNTVIEDSSIHHCGRLPSQNGDHGIYIQHSTGVIIRNNWIHDNADRGIQLYPDSQGTKVYGNVIDGNGEGVIFSGNEVTASSNNLVYDNVISNSKVRWNVESYWSDGVVGSGNIVRDNCVWASNATSQAGYYNTDGGILPRDAGGEGYNTSGNVIAKPKFVDAANGNFKLQGDSPCQAGARVVKLSADDKRVNSGAKVELHGHVTPAKSVRVTIQIMRHGHWRKFAQTRVRPNGKFKLRKRLRGRLVTDRARLRARAPRVGRSKPIAIRVR